MHTTHHISHIDLDGYTCTYLVHKYSKPSVLKLTQSNVDYDELTEHLTKVLSAVPKDEPLTHLLITDLNLKAKDVSVLLSYYDRYKNLTLIDHHRTHENEIRRLKTELPGCSLHIEQGTSATKLLHQWLTKGKAESSDLEVETQLVDLVDTYDIFRVEEKVLFNLGYLFNEWFMQLSKDLKPLVSAEGLRQYLRFVLRKFEDWTVADMVQDANFDPKWFYEHLDTFFEAVDTVELVEYGLIDPAIEQRLAELIPTMAPPQTRAITLACLATGPFGVAGESIYAIGAGNCLILDQPLPRGVLHQLMYTLETIDQYVMLSKPDKGRVEFRQHALKPMVDMSYVAAQWGGGGHVGAAGCHITEPWESFVVKVLDHMTVATQ